MNKNIPNYLSCFRIATVPLLFLFYFTSEPAFLTFIILGAFSDVLDGFIARRYNLCTPLGSKLDSIADNLFFPSLFIFSIMRNPSFYAEHYLWLVVPLALHLLAHLIGVIKHREWIDFHLYSDKVLAWIMTLFVLQTLIYPPNYFLLTISSAFACLAFLEQLLVVVFRSKIDKNVVSILSGKGDIFDQY